MALSTGEKVALGVVGATGVVVVATRGKGAPLPASLPAKAPPVPGVTVPVNVSTVLHPAAPEAPAPTPIAEIVEVVLKAVQAPAAIVERVVQAPAAVAEKVAEVVRVPYVVGGLPSFTPPDFTGTLPKQVAEVVELVREAVQEPAAVVAKVVAVVNPTIEVDPGDAFGGGGFAVTDRAHLVAARAKVAARKATEAVAQFQPGDLGAFDLGPVADRVRSGFNFGLPGIPRTEVRPGDVFGTGAIRAVQEGVAFWGRQLGSAINPFGGWF